MKLVWDESAWDDYVWWQTQDRKILKRINTLIRDVERNGNDGIGKPEPSSTGFTATGRDASPMSTGSSPSSAITRYE
jgi:Txe/YoeB family toxin of Txe-Axe toxin-antitoxin module